MSLLDEVATQLTLCRVGTSRCSSEAASAADPNIRLPAWRCRSISVAALLVTEPPAVAAITGSAHVRDVVHHRHGLVPVGRAACRVDVVLARRACDRLGEAIVDVLHHLGPLLRHE